MITAVLFVIGLGLLIGGAEWLVKGASRLAATFGISPLVIGLTVVAFGTSAPELAVTIHSTLNGKPDIAVGNVIGSNIANVLLILGLCALVMPLAVTKQLIRWEVPILIIVSMALFVLALDGQISRTDGLLLFSCAIIYTVFAIYLSRRERAQENTADNETPENHNLLANLALIIIGLTLLVIGANWLVDGAVAAARWLGVSELLIGLTIVAIGTSLPEIATSLIAILRGQSDIAVGNAIGSSLFNILTVLGLTSIVAPDGVNVANSVLQFDLLVMIAATIACLPILFTGLKIARWEGGLFLIYYMIYLTYLGLSATGHTALPTYITALLWFVFPLTAVTVLVSVIKVPKPSG